MASFIQTLSAFFQRETWIDQGAVRLQKAVNQVLNREDPARSKVADALNGVWLGHPLHPVLTDIPIGAWTAAVTLDSIQAGTGSRGMAKAADAAVALGVAGAVGSAVTGLADWQYTTGETRRTGMVHALLNTAALGFFVLSLLARAGRNRGAGRLLALAGYTVAGASAYLGGDLVFRQKMGVNHAPEEEDLEVNDFIPVLAVDQLPEDQPTIALLNTTPLVLGRRGERVWALAETCAHLGGPLADGRLAEDAGGSPVIVCPWHDSHFRMEDGEVVQGPSAYPQPCFEARINEGQVEIRRRLPQAG
jgi:nitrite reductase/ring-hydroxylating ferredoxin subunit/uncharacterized membrane protein